MKKYFEYLLLLTSIFFLLYTFYRSEIVLGGSKRDYYFLYYLFFLITALISISFYFMSNKIKVLSIIALGSILISFYIFEGYITLIADTAGEPLQKKVKIYEEKYDKKYDTRNKFQIYKDLNKKEKFVVSVKPQKYKDIYSLSGISKAKTIHCNENGYYSIFNSDRYGFNNPDSEWKAKEIEYLLVGDSYALGACINRPYDIASVLRKLSKKNVLTLGYDGNGPLKEYATLREYLNPNVKNILWIYYEGNDLDDISEELNSKILVNYLKSKKFSQKLISKQKTIDNFAMIQIDSEKKNYTRKNIFNFIKLYNTRGILNKFISKSFHPKDKIYEYRLTKDFENILILAKDLALKNNSNFYFVYIPISKFPKNEELYRKTKEVMRALDIPMIDIFKEVHQKEDDILNLFPLNVSGHYSEYGYRKIAETLNMKISK